MVAPVRVRGLKTAVRNLNREINKIEGRTVKGLLAAALFVKGESQEITPQKTGVLINSAFASAGTKSNGMPISRVGYTAKYAPWVHEMSEDNTFTKPDTGPKFLQKAVFENLSTILSIIRRRIRL